MAESSLFFATDNYFDWQPLVFIPGGLSPEVYTADLPASDIVKTTGRAKFVDEDQPNTTVRLGYQIAVELAPLDLSKVPPKYLKEKPVVIR